MIPLRQLRYVEGVLAEAAGSLYTPVFGTSTGVADSAPGADAVSDAAEEVRHTLAPMQGDLLAAGCDAEATIVSACQHTAARLEHTIDSWLVSASLQRFAPRWQPGSWLDKFAGPASGTIFEHQPLPADVYANAVADVKAFVAHPGVDVDAPRLASFAERLCRRIRLAEISRQASAVTRLRHISARFLTEASRRLDDGKRHLSPGNGSLTARLSSHDQRQPRSAPFDRAATSVGLLAQQRSQPGRWSWSVWYYRWRASTSGRR